MSRPSLPFIKTLLTQRLDVHDNHKMATQYVPPFLSFSFLQSSDDEVMGVGAVEPEAGDGGGGGDGSVLGDGQGAVGEGGWEELCQLVHLPLVGP